MDQWTNGRTHPLIEMRGASKKADDKNLFPKYISQGNLKWLQHLKPTTRSITVDTIEKKALIGSAIWQNSFVQNYKDGKESSSDEEW